MFEYLTCERTCGQWNDDFMVHKMEFASCYQRLFSDAAAHLGHVRGSDVSAQEVMEYLETESNGFLKFDK
eukprot:51828-Eustigmatos_ZCMA.PRE.1